MTKRGETGMRSRIRDARDRRTEVRELRDRVVVLTNTLAATRLAVATAIDAGIEARSEADEYRKWWEHAKDERDAAREIARRYLQERDEARQRSLRALQAPAEALQDDPGSWGER